MFWKRKKAPAVRPPGLTGTGTFIRNIDWWLWDDCASPGLIHYQKFDALRERVLLAEENRKLALFMVRDSVVSLHQKGSKHSPEQAGFAKSMFSKLDDYLVNL